MLDLGCSRDLKIATVGRAMRGPDLPPFEITAPALTYKECQALPYGV
jgi:hypothetical protein